jgi:hypothetical protein
MKKLPVASITALVLVLAFSASADAKCNTNCLNRKVKALAGGLAKAQQTITAQSQTIAQLSQKVSEQGQALTAHAGAINQQIKAVNQVNESLNCLVEAPLTQYGEPEGPYGYLFQFENEAEVLETIPTTGLDVTYEGDEVGAWALFDGCNGSKNPSAASSSALAPASGLSRLARPQARLLP